MITIIKQALASNSEKSNWFNQDNLRDNFTAVSLLVDACIVGVGVPGGALPSRLITSEEGTHLLAEALRKGVKYQSSDMLSSSNSRSKAQYWTLRNAVVQLTGDEQALWRAKKSSKS